MLRYKNHNPTIQGNTLPAPVLILPGFQNSDAQHWQTLWQHTHPEWVRVQQRDWHHPVRAEWVSALAAAVQSADANVVLVAHSLGCLTIAHSLAATLERIKGALLVAPPDTTRADFPAAIQGYAHTPMQPLPFPSIVVASSDDPYSSLSYAKNIATAWGSRFVNIGARGHINGNSGLGSWAQGYALLSELQQINNES